MTATTTKLPAFPAAPSWIDLDASMPPEQQQAVRDAFEQLAAALPTLDNAGRVLREAWDRSTPDMPEDVRETMSAATGVTALCELIMFAAKLLDGGLTLFLSHGEVDDDAYPLFEAFRALLDS